MLYKNSTPYRFLSIPLGVMLVFFFLPFIMAFNISMLDYSKDLYAPEFVGLANYTALFHSENFWRATINTFIFLFGVMPAMVVLPIGMAVLLNEKLRGIAIYRSLIYLPVVVSMVVVGIAWKWLYMTDGGLINYFFSLVGLPKVSWLVNPDIALVSVMIVVVWKGLAYYMMMYLAHLQSVSKELYEAADMDGANFWQRHRHITLPHLKPTMVMVAIISTIGSLKVFTEIYVMTRGGPMGSTKTLVYYIYEQAFEYLNLGTATAAGLVLMLVLLVLSLIQLRFTGWGSTDDEIPVARHGVKTS